MPTAGYSGTPLARKLGIKEDFDIWINGQPDYYFQLFDGLPISDQVVEVIQIIDFAHIFVTNGEMLSTQLNEILKHLKKEGMVWVSWPKGTSKIASEINREDVRRIGLDMGLVDVKVAAIDNDWSGLKFVYRLKDR